MMYDKNTDILNNHKSKASARFLSLMNHSFVKEFLKGTQLHFCIDIHDLKERILET